MTFRRGGGGGGRGRFGGRDDRGRPGGRDGPPRGGDRLSSHTSDAATASARIFIGNLPTNDSRLTTEILEENFSKFGQIMGISILKGFGFIQYADEASAESAIKGSQNLEILGQRADVKNVKSGKDHANTSGNGGPPSINSEPYRDRSPLRRREFDREPDMHPRMRDGPSARDMDRAAHDFDDRSRDWGRMPLDPYHGDPFMDRPRDMHPREPFPPMPERSFGAGPQRPAGLPMPNDVEIIVTSKIGPMRQYAELIEGRIRSHGMAVDVLFPREDIPIRQVLRDLSERGTLFACVLTPLNEEHRSVTLSILFGPQPEEHRNMPLEDALELLACTFQRCRGGGRPDEHLPAPVEAAARPEPHPASVQPLIDVLHANRPLSVMEYDRLIRYLTDRRDRLANEEARGPNSQSFMKGGFNATTGAGQENPVELQQRIMSILSSSAGGSGGSLGPVPAPVPAPAAPPSWNAAGDSAGQPPGGYYGMGKRF